MNVENQIRGLETVEIQERNFIQTYLPFRNKSAVFDFSAIAGNLIAGLIGKGLPKGYDLKSFEEDCRERIEQKLSDPNFSSTIQSMYFNGGGVFQVSPIFFLFKEKKAGESGNKHMSQLFQNLISPHDTSSVQFTVGSEQNFLEQELLSELGNKLQNREAASIETPYLPFISDYFTKDVVFLSKNKGYFLSNIEKLLKIYAFLYCSQLALNLNGWSEEPRTKPMHFILDTEKASIERSEVKRAHKDLVSRVGDLFPVLSVLEYFNHGEDQKYPFWQYFITYSSAPEKEREQFDSALRNFLRRYREKRQLAEFPDLETLSGTELFKAVTVSATSVFAPSRKGNYPVKERYVKNFLDNIAGHFVQRRGRSGYVLIVNQDNLLLLTNLAIGQNQKISFRNLLDEFRSRGLWFDRQSETALMNFFERVGNIERMSDSGDAVYVKKTI
jgi:DNA phosphorothioation-dependent restriction protein DptG